MNRTRSDPSTGGIVILGTSSPNRFRTTSSILSFFYKNNIIRKFEVEQCSICPENGEIMMRFGTIFSAQIFSLKLQVSEAVSRYFQIIKLNVNQLNISQFIMLNLCVQRRSRDSNKFNNIIRRWRSEGIIDCDADKRQFYLYLFKDNDNNIKNNNDCYIKLTIDDRILDKICLLNNDYSAAIQFECAEPPKCEIHKEPTIISIDQKHKNYDDESKENDINLCPKRWLECKCDDNYCSFCNISTSKPTTSTKEQICPKFLFTGSCTNKSCVFKHNINSSDAETANLGNNRSFWSRKRPLNGINEENYDRNNNKTKDFGWKPAAYHSFKHRASKEYVVDLSSDELEQKNNQYTPWVFEIGDNQDSMESLLKFLGQCWIFCVEFVRMKQVPERFINAIREMRGINPSWTIPNISTDYEAQYIIPKLFTNNKQKLYYRPPLQYLHSSRSSEIRLKRHIHDLNYNGAHDIAFCLEACLNNFPPVFIPEDLFDITTKNDDGIGTDTHSGYTNDIFFACLQNEIDSKLNDDDAKIDNVDIIWQALLHCAKNKLYIKDRSVVTNDFESNDRNQLEKQNVLPALELFYKSLEWATSNGHKLRQKQNGNTHADHVWIKRVSITPLRLSLDITEEESTRMFRFKQYSPPRDFCRIQFMDEHSNRSMKKNHFNVGNDGRYRAYKILQNGLNIAGVTYEFLFFGNKQVRDAKCWMKAELIRGFDANRVRADIARLSQERNIGKKMDRFHLFMSKGTPGSIYEENEIEIIDDIHGKDGKILTDGCSLILKSELKQSFPKYVASMLVRIGGAKTQMMMASKQLLQKLILDDIKKKKSSSNFRNLSPKIILTKSCLKFVTDTEKQLEIKKCCRSSPCMLNREIINMIIFHRLCELQPSALHIINNKCYDTANSFKLNPNNKQRILNLFLKYQRSFINQLQRMENICIQQTEILKNMKQRYGARSIYIHKTSEEEEKMLFDTLLFLSSRLRVEESFLYRLTLRAMRPHYAAAKRLHFKDISDLTEVLKRLWGDLKSKFKVQLTWPSCRMAGVADFQYKLKEFQVFLKIKYPDYYDWNCQQCGKNGIKYWKNNCDNSECGASHPIYYIHRGPVGVMKNPCLHPGSYRKFNAVYYAELDEIFDGEVLVFSASSKYCSTSQVHKLSGGDLDGDDFLCIIQQDLLPLNNDFIKCMEYDSDKPLKMSGYVDITMCVQYWLNYQNNDTVGMISELHESFSDLELGVGSPQCLELAMAHSKAVDYAKTGIYAKIPSSIGVNKIKFPHYMGKHPSISYRSTSIKGILFNKVRIPDFYWRDKEFRKQYNLRNYYNMRYYQQQKSIQQRPTTYRDRLREKLKKGCQICGISSFANVHEMNRHNDTMLHRQNKVNARDKTMLQRIKDAQNQLEYESNIQINVNMKNRNTINNMKNHQFHQQRINRTFYKNNKVYKGRGYRRRYQKRIYNKSTDYDLPQTPSSSDAEESGSNQNQIKLWKIQELPINT